MNESLQSGSSGLSSLLSGGVPDAKLFKYTPEGKAAKKALIAGATIGIPIFLYFILPFLITILTSLIIFAGFAIVATVSLAALAGIWFVLTNPKMQELAADKWRIFMHNLFYRTFEKDPVGYLQAGIAWAKDGLKIVEKQLGIFNGTLKETGRMIDRNQAEIEDSITKAKVAKKMEDVPFAGNVLKSLQSKVGRREDQNKRLRIQHERMKTVYENLLEVKGAMVLEIDDMGDAVEMAKREFESAKSGEAVAETAASVIDQYGSRKDRWKMAYSILQKQTDQSLGRLDFFMSTVQRVVDQRKFEELYNQERGSERMDEYEREVNELSQQTKKAQLEGQQTSNQVRRLLEPGSSEPISTSFYTKGNERSQVAVPAQSEPTKKDNRYRNLFKRR